MNIVDHHLELYHEMAMIVREKETAVLATGGMRGDELIMKTHWFNFIEGC